MKRLINKIREQKGFNLIETLIAVAMLAIGIVALAELFAVSIKQNAVADDLTTISSYAQDKMEELKDMSYKSLTASGDAGSITSAVTGYIDNPESYYQRLWEIDVDAPVTDMTTIRVTVKSSRRLIGEKKECTLVLTRSR